MDIRTILSWAWDILKIFVLPICIFLLQRQITQRDDKREREYSARKKEQDDIQYLMMQRLDKLSEITHLMAQKLHDQNIINGDLEKLDQKYKELDAEYEDKVKRLALAYSKR